MGDRCYMQVWCHQDNAASFEALGFEIDDTDGGLPDGVVTLQEYEANYAHCDEMPTGFPYFGYHTEGGNYPAMVYACDGKVAELRECVAVHGEPVVFVQDGEIKLDEYVAYQKARHAAMVKLGYTEGLPNPVMWERLKIDTAGVRQALIKLLDDIMALDELFHIGLWLTPDRHWIVARMDDGQDGWTVLGTGTAEDEDWDSTADMAMHLLGQIFHNREPFEAHGIEIV